MSASILVSALLFIHILSITVNSQNHLNYNSDSQHRQPVLNPFQPELSSLLEWIHQPHQGHLITLLRMYQSPLTSTQCPPGMRLLDQIIGLMKVAIWNNSLYVNEVMSLAGEFNTKLGELQGRAESLQYQKQRIGLPRMKLGLEQLLQILGRKYHQITTTAHEVSKNQVIRQNNSDQISKLHRLNSEQRATLLDKNVELSLINNKISAIQAELVALKTKKLQTSKQITSSNIKINSLSQQITALQQQNTKITKQISILQGNKQRINKQTVQLQSQLTTSSQQIRNLEEPYQQILLKIDQNRQQMSEVTQQLNGLVSPSILISKNIVLTGFIQQYEGTMMEVYFQCNSKDSKSVLYASERKYRLSNFDLSLYLASIYSDRVILPQANVGDQYEFTYIDLFGSLWTSNFGFPFDDTDIMENSLLLKGDQTCQKSEANYFGNGIATFISRNKIQVMLWNQNRIILLLGPCTRLQSQKSIPEVNQTIYFKGIWRSYSVLNAFHITFF